MRPLLLALLLLAPAGVAAAEDDETREAVVTLVPWTDGAFLAGARVGVVGANAVDVPLTVGECHRKILVDLLYDPADTNASAERVGEVALLYTFRAELRSGSAVTATTDIRSPGYGKTLGTALPGEHDLRLVLTQGALVSWSLRVRAWELPDEPACGTTVP